MAATKSPGATSDDDVNDVHYDIEYLTVEHLVELVPVIAAAEKSRLYKIDVRSLLSAGIEAGHVDKSRIKAKIIDNLHPTA